MEGNKNPARFSGAMNNYVSQLFENTPADVAALYFISYLYHQEWDHADAVALRGSDGSVNTPKVVRDAYRSKNACGRVSQTYSWDCEHP